MDLECRETTGPCSMSEEDVYVDPFADIKCECIELLNAVQNGATYQLPYTLRTRVAHEDELEVMRELGAFSVYKGLTARCILLRGAFDSVVQVVDIIGQSCWRAVDSISDQLVCPLRAAGVGVELFGPADLIPLRPDEVGDSPRVILSPTVTLCGKGSYAPSLAVFAFEGTPANTMAAMARDAILRTDTVHTVVVVKFYRAYPGQMSVAVVTRRSGLQKLVSFGGMTRSGAFYPDPDSAFRRFFHEIHSEICSHPARPPAVDVITMVHDVAVTADVTTETGLKASFTLGPVAREYMRK